MTVRPVRAAVAVALLAFSCGAGAEVTLANAWMRPAAPGDDAAAYVDIRSDTALSLVAVTTPVAKAVEIVVAENFGDGGATKTVKTFDVPAGRETRFAYRGNVLRLVGVKEQLANGTPVPLTLDFRDAAGKTLKATTNVEVRGLVVHRAPAAPATAVPPDAGVRAAPKPIAAPEPAPKM